MTEAQNEILETADQQAEEITSSTLAQLSNLDQKEGQSLSIKDLGQIFMTIQDIGENLSKNKVLTTEDLRSALANSANSKIISEKLEKLKSRTTAETQRVLEYSLSKAKTKEDVERTRRIIQDMSLSFEVLFENTMVCFDNAKFETYQQKAEEITKYALTQLTSLEEKTGDGELLANNMPLRETLNAMRGIESGIYDKIKAMFNPTLKTFLISREEHKEILEKLQKMRIRIEATIKNLTTKADHPTLKSFLQAVSILNKNIFEHTLQYFGDQIKYPGEEAVVNTHTYFEQKLNPPSPPRPAEQPTPINQTPGLKPQQSPALQKLESEPATTQTTTHSKLTRFLKDLLS